ELKTDASRGRLWSRSYFVATVGNVSAHVVKKYVEEQWVKER
ncbi:MAG: transposase, partial [Sulfolobales archaeon]